MAAAGGDERLMLSGEGPYEGSDKHVTIIAHGRNIGVAAGRHESRKSARRACRREVA